MRLLKFTSGKAKDLIKHFINEEEDCYNKAMERLEIEYGSKEVVTECYLKKIREWPSLKQSDTAKFKELHWFLLQCQTYKKSGLLCELDSTSIIRSIVAKLHTSYHDKWACKVECIKRSDGRQVNFNDLVGFVDFHLSCVNNPSFSFDAMNEEKRQVKSCYTNHKTEHEGRTDELCSICKGKKHNLEDCLTFMSRQLADRRKMLRDERVCFTCLNPSSKNHPARVCKNRSTCKICQKRHPTCLHDDSKPAEETQEKYCDKGESNKVDSNKNEINSNTVNYLSNTNTVISMCIVPIYISHVSCPDKELLCYAMLDKCCTGCLATPEILHAVAPEQTEKAYVTIKTVNCNSEENAIAVNGLLVRRFGDKKDSLVIKLPTTFSSKTVPADRNEIPTAGNTEQWRHLDSIRHLLP